MPPVTRKRPQREEEKETNREETTTMGRHDAIPSRRKLRKFTHHTNQEQHHTQMEEKSEEDPTDNEMREGDLHEEAAAAATETTTMTTDSNTSTAVDYLPHLRSIPPHGILKLPQSIASALASDFLEKREIRDLGVTCSWMLVSLNQCIIREAILLRSAVRRLKRERLLHSSTKVCAQTQALRQTVSRIRNLFVGRFSTINFTSPKLLRTEINQLAELHQLVDTRKLILSVGTGNQRELASILPLDLPPRLVNLEFDRVTGLPPLSKFTLPGSLRRIHWREYGLSSFWSVNDLPRVKWPSGLKSLINVSNSCSPDGLTLPNALSTLIFDSRMASFTNITLPNTITNLDIKWSDVTGRYYHDLPFPPLLKRLVLHCELSNDDFNLNEWAHLPKSCKNIQLTLSRDRVALSLKGDPAPSSPLAAATPILIIPSFVKILRIFYDHVPQRSRLDLTTATSLNAFETNKLDDINWPSSLTSPSANDGGGLSIKVHGDSSDVPSSTTTLPPYLVQLDLGDVFWTGWSADLFEWCRRCEQLTTSVSNLQRVKFAHLSHPPATHQIVKRWSQAVPDCLFEFGLPSPNAISSPAHSSGRTLHPPHSSSIVSYQHGRLIQPIRYCTTEQVNEWKSERERYDIIPNEE